MSLSNKILSLKYFAPSVCTGNIVTYVQKNFFFTLFCKQSHTPSYFTSTLRFTGTSTDDKLHFTLFWIKFPRKLNFLRRNNKML